MKYAIPAALGAALAALLALCPSGRHPDLALIQEGKATLGCEFYSGWKEVAPEKITGFEEDRGRWLFVNGSASAMNCVVQVHDSVIEEADRE